MAKFKLYSSVLIIALAIGSCKDEELIEVTITTLDFTVTIDENPTEGQVLGQVEGTTNKGNVTFSITSEIPIGAMTIDNNTGELSVTNVSLYNYEVRQVLNAVVTLANGDITKNINITINLNDLVEPISFTQVQVSGIQFSERYMHQLVEFNNKLWVIGGDDGNGSSYFNDIWSSSDGTNWTQETIIGTQFSLRRNHQAVAFNNKLWVIGGNAQPFPLHATDKVNDVWSSSDGINWTQEIAVGATFSPRSYHQAVAFNNKLWVIGGSSTEGYSNDVWSSSDGKNWTQESIIGDFISERSGHQVIVFNNKLWIIGGVDNTSNQGLNDIWSSSDGTNWIQETVIGTHFSERYHHQVVAYDKKLWLITGLGYDDVWSSSDGINWIQETIQDNYFNKRYGHRIAVFNNKLWFTGGVTGGEWYNDIWSLD